jgi:kynurenine formamidase
MALPLTLGPLAIDLARVVDVSVPVRFGEAESRAFSLPAATTAPVAVGSVVGDVRRGGSCNCETHHFTPHADGTHTEGPGHLLARRLPVRVDDVVCLAALVRVRPRPLGDVADEHSGNHRHDDLVVDVTSVREALDAVVVDAALPVGVASPTAVVIVTGSGDARRTARFSGTNPPYLTVEAAAHLRERGVRHVLVDLPSLDREDDGGLLAAHRAFFDLPVGVGAADVDGDADEAPLPRTVTELIAVDDDVAVGLYALFLQVPSMLADAVPSRPLLAPVRPVSGAAP